MNENYTRAPHRHPQQEAGASPNAALLIDFDNVTMAMRSNLGQELRNFLNSDIVRGKVSVQRAYADWRRYPQYIVPLSEASIDLIFAPAYGSSKKNATDIRLAIDALELVFTRPEIGTYILLSGDSDFSSLVLKLKEFGKYVIGVGLQESTSDLLVQNCDEYYSYNSLSGLTSAEDMDTSSLGPWELVEKAVQRMDERNDVMRSDRLKQVMLEFDSGFDEKDHGFSKFNRFLAEASSRGLVRLRKIGDGHYEVAPVEREEAETGAQQQTATQQQQTATQQQQKEAPSRPEPIETGDGEPQGREASGSSGERKQEGGRGRGSRGRSGQRGRGDGAGGDRGRQPTDAGVGTAPLRRAYDLLRDVVDDLSDDGAAVRDSEIKREMLRREGNFDEAALGFSKFSRFLRQAYDEGVVELTTDSDGNFHLQPAGAEPVTFEEPGTADQREQPAGPEAETPGAADERPSRDAAGEQPEPGREAEPAGSTPESPEAPAASGQAADEPAAESGEEPQTQETEPPEEPQPSERRRRGGLGRFRRGSRSGKPDSSDGDGGESAVGVGPVDEPADGGGPSADGAEDSGGPDAGSADDGPETGRRRRSGGLGRFRRGSRSGDDQEASGGDADGDGGGGVPGPVDEEPTEASAGSGPEADAGGTPPGRRDVTAGGDGGAPSAAPVPDEAADDPVAYMVGNYPGVGRKTAEKLLDAFGDDLFRVIDREPDRLMKVLPDHRARAVVDAREAERERSAS